VHLVGAFNWDAGQPLKIEYPMGKLGLDAATTYVGFDFWADQFVPPFSGALRADVPAAACQILALRPAASHPQLISTSRHITQGLVDVLEEKWDAKSGVLSGRSKVVAGDRYELRVVVPTGESSWVLATSEIPGQAAEATQAGPQVRAAFTPAAGGEVAWRLLFKRGAVAEPVAAKPAGLTATSSYRRVRLSWTPDDALAYRVTRNDGATWQVTKAELTDSTLAAGARATYQVSARGWSDRWSEAAEVTAETPAQLVAPPVPPAPTVKLGDLKLVADKTGWGDTKVNRSVEGKPLTVGGKVYEQGIGTHANALQVYDIPAGMTRFVATVGLDDEQKHDPRASVVAKVYGDVKEMGEKPELLAESPVLSDGSIRFWHIQATLSPRHRQVRLVIEDAGDGINADHADWVNAGFLKP
jgi:hypothetical protein